MSTDFSHYILLLVAVPSSLSLTVALNIECQCSNGASVGVVYGECRRQRLHSQQRIEIFLDNLWVLKISSHRLNGRCD